MRLVRFAATRGVDEPAAITTALLRDFIYLLKDLDLFEVKTATFTPFNPDGTPSEPQKIADYFGVSEAKLNALPTEKLIELRDNGALQ